MNKTLISALFASLVLTGCANTTTTEQVASTTVSTANKVADELQKGVAIYFNTNSSTIDPKYDVYLSTAKALLAANPNLVLVVEGHTDNRGSVATNKKLSLSRANSVKNTLVSNYKVATAQIKTLGAGSAKPIDDNNTAVGRANNRRVTLQLASN